MDVDQNFEAQIIKEYKHNSTHLCLTTVPWCKQSNQDIGAYCEDNLARYQKNQGSLHPLHPSEAMPPDYSILFYPGLRSMCSSFEVYSLQGGKKA